MRTGSGNFRAQTVARPALDPQKHFMHYLLFYADCINGANAYAIVNASSKRPPVRTIRHVCPTHVHPHRISNHASLGGPAISQNSGKSIWDNAQNSPKYLGKCPQRWEISQKSGNVFGSSQKFRHFLVLSPKSI